MDMMKNNRKTALKIFACAMSVMIAAYGLMWLQPAIAADEVQTQVEYESAAGASSAPTFNLYKVGTVDGGVFTLDSPYDESGVSTDFSNETTDAEWDQSAATLYNYIRAKGIGEADQTAKPDGSGMMTFGLEKYVLYVIGTDDVTVNGGKKYGAKPMFLWVIEGNTEKISIKPYGVPDDTDKTKKYTVVKHWKSDSKEDRPAKVTVEIYEDNELCETVELDQSNDWTYSWEDKDGKGIWTCVEKDVPDGYTVKVTTEAGGSKIMITNTGKVQPKPVPPSKTRTGDPTAMRWSLIAMGVSGLVLLAAGIRRRRNDY